MNEIPQSRQIDKLLKKYDSWQPISAEYERRIRKKEERIKSFA